MRSNPGGYTAGDRCSPTCLLQCGCVPCPEGTTCRGLHSEGPYDLKFDLMCTPDPNDCQPGYISPGCNPAGCPAGEPAQGAACQGDAQCAYGWRTCASGALHGQKIPNEAECVGGHWLVTPGICP